MADCATKLSAIIADDHEIVRSGLSAALQNHDFFDAMTIEVVAEAAHGIETIELVKKHRPDLLFLDVSMPLASGAEILTDIQRWSAQTKIIVITAVTAPGLLSGMVEAGVDGLFSKASDNEELFKNLPLIVRGGKFVATALAAIIRDAEPAPSLSGRERQTLNMIIAGKSNNEIANLMGISPRTAEKHRASLMAKVGVKSTVELMTRALRDGLIDSHDHLN